VFAYQLLFVGRRAKDPLLEAQEQYLARLSRYAKVDVVRIKDTSPVKEGAEMLAHLIPKARLIALDEHGTSWSTLDLAKKISGWQRDGTKVVWAVGGADGLDGAVRAQAREIWSLSRLTLPHRLAQVLLIEQLYRAHSLLRGEPYHRA
jgi:23S rRNA (pseudouridine1915-N3)-methyltransferase